MALLPLYTPCLILSLTSFLHFSFSYPTSHSFNLHIQFISKTCYFSIFSQNMENNNNSATKSNKNDDNSTTASKNELNPSTSNNNINDLMVVLSNGVGEIQQSADTRISRTDLSQQDADLALASTLQQERAHMMFGMSADGIPYGNWGPAVYVHGDYDEDFNDPSEDEYDSSNVDDDEDEDAFDFHAPIDSGEDEDQGASLDPSQYPDDAAYARALEDAEERGMATRLRALAQMNEDEILEHTDLDDEDAFDFQDHIESEEGEHQGAPLDRSQYPDDAAYARALEDDEERGMATRLRALARINDDDEDDDGQDSQGAWEEVDPDEMSYEELIALGEVVGTHSRGLPAETITSLPTVNYKSERTREGSNDLCVICLCDYEDDETLTVLSCKHSYHSECVTTWLLQNKVCPICNTEVSTSGNS